MQFESLNIKNHILLIISFIIFLFFFFLLLKFYSDLTIKKITYHALFETEDRLTPSEHLAKNKLYKEDQAIFLLSLWVAKKHEFRTNKTKFSPVIENPAKQNILERLNPVLKILERKEIPSWFRFQSGFYDLINQKYFYCDSAVRMLGAMVSSLGYTEACQLNIINYSSGSHSVLSFKHQQTQKEYMVDPLYGGIPFYKDCLNFQTLQSLLNKGFPAEKIFLPLVDKPDYSFYSKFSQIACACQGEKLEIIATLPKMYQKELILNQKNMNLYRYFNYFGSIYSRDWVRSFKAVENVTIEFQLNSKPDISLIKSNKPYLIRDNTVIFRLLKNEKLIFHNRKAKRYYLNPSRNSQPISQIRLKKLLDY